MSGLLEGGRHRFARQSGANPPRAVNKNIRAADPDEWKRVLIGLTRSLNIVLGK